MLDVCNDPRIDLTLEGSFSPECVHPTRMASRPQPSAALAARLRDDLWLAASPTRAWLSTAAPDTTQQITAPAVRSLLDGALAAASVHGALRELPSSPTTPALRIWRLVGYYHLTRSFTLSLEFAAERFAAEGQLALADWARARARERQQHDACVLRDLKSANVDPARALAALRPHPAERLVAWLRTNVVADPIGCVGYAYAIEHLAVELGAVELHDTDLCDQTVALLTRLSATRCEGIVRAAFELACRCALSLADSYPDEAVIAERLG
jgi:hypothetical protein